MAINVYILTKNGNEITENGRKIVGEAVVKNTKADTVDLLGGVLYNNAKHLVKVLTEDDIIGVSVPEKSECFFISEPDSIKGFKEALQKASDQSSWQVAMGFIEM